jgi:DNA/RNA endonuclease YhcR with UshA esterase domain
MITTRLLAASAVFGLWAVSTAAATLSSEDAKAHIGETATVCGVVVSAEYEANEQSQPTLLDLGTPYPNAIFTAVIYRDHRQKFGTPEISLRGKQICVTGPITDYQGKPEIVLKDPSQLSQ